jgi:hypothetical protein
MRTKTLLAAAAMLAAGLASSVAQSNVYSLNVVGYVNKVLTGGNKYTAVANPLNTSANTLSNLFGGAGVGLPAGSIVLKWNTGTADYDSYLKTGFGAGWSPVAGASVLLDPGEGALVHIDGADYTNTFVGEVLQGTLTVNLPTGYSLIANKVPDSGPANTIGLGGLSGPQSGDVLLQWNVGTQDFDSYLKTGFGLGWNPSVPNINVAEGFFINASSATNWVRNFTVQ